MDDGGMSRSCLFGWNMNMHINCSYLYGLVL